ncbi:hypothetical protein [Actinoplanes sp. NPDC051494]|uniref:hypothetical protein n=1 Tax=Actinoplanes sp. NPDC051494 TaxID=3363907 RepID=UPI00379DB54C
MTSETRDELQPGVHVHDAGEDRRGYVTGRHTSRNAAGPIREIVVDFSGVEVSFVNEQRARLTVVPT